VKYRISRSDGDLVALAGACNFWHRGEDQEIVSYATLTSVPSGPIAELHDRMPVILGEKEWDE
jgi:putative SOS response-associated peptidase YedK